MAKSSAATNGTGIESFWPLIVFFLAAVAMMVTGYGQTQRLDLYQESHALPVWAREIGRAVLYGSLAYLLSFLLVATVCCFRNGQSLVAGHGIFALILLAGVIAMLYVFPVMYGAEPHEDESIWFLQGGILTSFMLSVLIVTLPSIPISKTPAVKRWAGNHSLDDCAHAFKAAAAALSTIPVVYFLYSQSLAFECQPGGGGKAQKCDEGYFWNPQHQQCEKIPDASG